MYAAASGHSNIGIPQNVGEKFVAHADSGRSAGILFVTDDGQTLFMHRGDGGDYPRTFGLPGGHQEPGESLEDTARRETLEETGLDFKGALKEIHDNGQFKTFLASIEKPFPVVICDESVGYSWSPQDSLPQPIHPALIDPLRIVAANTEFKVAELIREGILPSPQQYGNMHLLAIRITGTGLAYRSGIKEHVWRDPSIYLNPEFLQRCQGLTVIMDHPDGATLDTKEFTNRAIGSVMLPYIQGEEVWGIAKIYDAPSMTEILKEAATPEGISTSPSVVFDSDAKNTVLTTESGDPLLIEGVPFLLDHIAIVTKAHGSKGVWDKGGDPTGVLITNPEVSMTDKLIDPKADAHGLSEDAKLDAILKLVTGLSSRMDSVEKNMPSGELMTAADKKRKDDDDEKARKDADDAKRKDDDDAKKRKDDDDKARKDAEEKAKGELEGKSGYVKPDDDARKGDDEAAAKADEIAAEYADAQAKADSVMSAFGKSASRPLAGEQLISYRKRLLRGLQAHSDSYKGVNISAVKDVALLNIIEKQVFADAMSAAKSPVAYADNQLFEVKTRDESGRTITKFRGAMSAWLDDFKMPGQRVMQFHPKNNQR